MADLLDLKEGVKMILNIKDNNEKRSESVKFRILAYCIMENHYYTI
jgi:hypothetical protein